MPTLLDTLRTRLARWTRRPPLADTVLAQAREHLAAGRTPAALALLRMLAHEVHSEGYDASARVLAGAYVRAGAARAASVVGLYTRDAALLAELGASDPRAGARAALLEGRHDAAAARFDAAGWPAHAALAYERAGRWDEASARWRALVDAPRLVGAPYLAALARFKLGCALSELGARDEGVAQLRAAGEALCALASANADRAPWVELDARWAAAEAFQQAGAPAESLDALRAAAAALRAHRQDNLAARFAWQIARRCEAAGWFDQAADALDEAARDAARALFERATAIARHAAAMRARAGEVAAARGEADRARAALERAAEAWTALGEHGRARAVRAQIAELPGLSATQRAPYRDAAIAPAPATVLARDEPADPWLTEPPMSGAPWDDDLRECETADDPCESCADVLLEAALPDYVRRKALLAALCWLESQGDAPAPEPPTRARALAALGATQVYPALAPLVRAFDAAADDPPARVAALEASRALYFAATFALVHRGLADPDRRVADAARSVAAGMTFPHAFAPLAQLHEHAPDAETRALALRTIGRVHCPAAIEYLLERVARGPAAPDALIAAQLLAEHPDPRATDLIARAAAPRTDATAPELAALFALIARARGGAPPAREDAALFGPAGLALRRRLAHRRARAGRAH